MSNPFQEEYANALENLRNANERNAALERELDSVRNELEAALFMLYSAESPKAALVPQPEPFAEDVSLPFTPDEYDAPE